jgi:DnaJ-class molecular chaperone
MVQVVFAPWPMAECPKCEGSGRRAARSSNSCTTCAGTGRVADDHRGFLIVETATTAENLVLRSPSDKAILW